MKTPEQMLRLQRGGGSTEQWHTEQVSPTCLWVFALSFTSCVIQAKSFNFWNLSFLLCYGKAVVPTLDYWSQIKDLSWALLLLIHMELFCSIQGRKHKMAKHSFFDVTISVLLAYPRVLLLNSRWNRGDASSSIWMRLLGGLCSGRREI